ncbi:MAG: DUF92 domain-containing protein [Candidatus Velthaea sp.]
MGALTYGSGTWAFTLVLLAFFLPSVLLSRVGRAQKRQLTDIGKGGARDAWQVLANGGLATACAVLAGLRLEPALVAAFAGAYAAATADTWGTEIGTLMGGKPRSVITMRPIATGLSGGVTRAGSLAELAGAAWIAAATLALVPFLIREFPGLAALAPWHLALAVFTGGLFGALADSVLGATLQELRSCPACRRACETNPHACGTPTTLVRGVRGFSNDLVNFAATFTGAAVAFLFALI